MAHTNLCLLSLSMCFASKASHAVRVLGFLQGKGEQAGSAGPSVSHVVRLCFFTIIFLVPRQRERGSGFASCWRTNGRFSMRASHTHSHTHPRHKQTGLGLSPSAAASLPSPAPPPPHQPSAGERQRRNERLGVVYLRADEQGDDSEPPFALFGFVALTLTFRWFTWRPRGSEAALVASRGPSTQPGST